MGSELERRGVDCSAPLWSARALTAAPEAVLAIHRENVAAGAEILTANTFRTTRYTLDRAGMIHTAFKLTQLAVSLAKKAAREAGHDVWIAGSMAPLADCYRPDLVPQDDVLAREHRANAQNLRRAGVDLFLVETVNAIRELRAAVEAAAQTALPVIASIVTDGKGRLISGESIDEAVRAVAPADPVAFGVNCVSSETIEEDFRRLVVAAGEVPVAIYANTISSGDTPEEYSARAARWLAAGARIIGGCCGTTPAHTASLRRLLQPDFHGDRL